MWRLSRIGYVAVPVLLGLIFVYGFNSNFGLSQDQQPGQVLARGTLAFQQSSEGELGVDSYRLYRWDDELSFQQQATFEVPQENRVLDMRPASVTRLSEDFEPSRYELLRVISIRDRAGRQEDDVRVSFDGNIARLQRDLTFLPGDGSQAQTDRKLEESIEAANPWLIQPQNLFSYLALYPRVLEIRDQAEIQVTLIQPLNGETKQRILRKMDTVVISSSDGDRTVNRIRSLEVSSETPTIDILYQMDRNSINFLGAVQAGGTEPIAFRKDLFPDGFEVVTE